MKYNLKSLINNHTCTLLLRVETQFGLSEFGWQSVSEKLKKQFVDGSLLLHFFKCFLGISIKNEQFFSLSCNYIFNFWSYYSSTWPSLKNTLNFYFELLWLTTKSDNPSFSYWIVIGISKFIFLHGLNKYVHVNVLSEQRNLKLSKQVALCQPLLKKHIENNYVDLLLLKGNMETLQANLRHSSL